MLLIYPHLRKAEITTQLVQTIARRLSDYTGRSENSEV